MIVSVSGSAPVVVTENDDGEQVAHQTENGNDCQADAFDPESYGVNDGQNDVKLPVTVVACFRQICASVSAVNL